MKKEIQEEIKQTIIRIYDSTTDKDYLYNMGYVEGMRKVLPLLSDYSGYDEDIKAAQSRMFDRLFLSRR